MTSLNWKKEKEGSGELREESKETGLHKVQKVERAEKVCREWHEAYCVQETYAG